MYEQATKLLQIHLQEHFTLMSSHRKSIISAQLSCYVEYLNSELVHRIKLLVSSKHCSPQFSDPQIATNIA